MGDEPTNDPAAPRPPTVRDRPGRATARPRHPAARRPGQHAARRIGWRPAPTAHAGPSGADRW